LKNNVGVKQPPCKRKQRAAFGKTLQTDWGMNQESNVSWYHRKLQRENGGEKNRSLGLAKKPWNNAKEVAAARGENSRAWEGKKKRGTPK